MVMETGSRSGGGRGTQLRPPGSARPRSRHDDPGHGGGPPVPPPWNPAGGANFSAPTWRPPKVPDSDQRLRRPSNQRLIAGVCQGLAEQLRVPVIAVRVAFIVLTMFNGVGLLAYVVLWAILPQSDDTRSALDAMRHAARRGRPAAAERAMNVLSGRTLATPDTWSERVRLLMFGIALIACAGLVLAARYTDQVQLSVVAPVAAVLAGASIGLGWLDRTERERGLSSTSLSSWSSILRIAGGLLLVIIGVVLLLTRSLTTEVLVTAGVAAIAVLGGLTLVGAPYLRQLLRNLDEERGQRVRQEERAEIAAHLHDSVLQTLALIQRRSGDADTVARLARSQERQLREYLYGAVPSEKEQETSLSVAVRRICADVEDTHGVPVEVVTVSDTTITPASAALVQALREALLNAVRHGKVGVSVYVEASQDGSAEAFVRDRGPGFDLDSVPTDRLGVRESVIGRMQRAGGSAKVRRAPGGGAEVALQVPGAQQ